jgi:hypothetical protein
MKNIYNNVASTTLVFLGILFFSGFSYSQDPWKAKIMLHNPTTNQVDTVWIGCDVAGGYGFQEGLDIMDTSLKSFSIYSHDSTITSPQCFNLKEDYRNFINGSIYFNVQIVDTTAQAWNEYDYIKIDTNDFKFDNDYFKITYVYVQVLNGGYLEFVDNFETYIYTGYDTIDDDPTFIIDSISLILESNPFNCLQLYGQMRLKLVIGFNDYLTTGLSFDKPIGGYKIFPNPTSGLLTLENSFQYENIELFDLSGRMIYQTVLPTPLENGLLDLTDLQEGLYVLRLHYKKDSRIINLKLIISNH